MMRCVLLAAALLLAVPAVAQPVDPADLAFWQSIQNSKNTAEYQAYLQAFPNGRFAALARLRAGQGGVPAGAPAAAPAPAGVPGAIDAMAFSKEAIELKRAGMFAKYRGQTITIQGRFQSFSDLGVGDMVSFQFIEPQERFIPRMRIHCSFPKRDTKAYDTFAQMEIGATVVVQAQVYDVQDVFQSVDLRPCAVIQPALHRAAAGSAPPAGPAWPPNGSYACTVYGGAGVGAIRILDRGSYADPDGKRGRYAFDQASGQITFRNGIWGDESVGWYTQPGSPSSGASTSSPTIELAQGKTPRNKTIHCNLRS